MYACGHHGPSRMQRPARRHRSEHMSCSARFCADSRPYMDCLVPHSDNSRWDKTAHSILVPRSLAVPLPELQGIQRECSCTQECELLHDSSPCCRRDSTVEVSKVVPRGKAIRGSPTIRSSVAQPRLRLRPICGRYFEVSGVIMMPSHDIGVQERALCSNRRSTCDYSR